jgi:hypothetical protein
MTLGSPIDKHLVLWPELFGETPPRSAPDQPIQWHNYYDHGDPIGFALDDARAWLQDQKWDGVFDFPPEHDHGFTRYAFPGKAHIDYWNDDAVFGHFIKHVVTETPAEPARFQQPPQDRLQAKWLSYALPYAGVFALLAAAVFILYKAVVEATAPNAPELHASGRILVEVLRTSLVLLGITIAARVPRLTRHVGLRLTALGAAALTCAVYFGVAQVLPASGPAIFDLPPGATTAILAGVVVALSYVLAVFLPSWGVTPMMLAGALVVGGKVAWHVMTSEARDTGEVWPVFFATAVFLYLWWLAALTFDLVVIWHWYIRHAQILARMDEILGGTRGGPERARTPGIAPPAGYAPQEQR